jgi:hypothetical protein
MTPGAIVDNFETASTKIWFLPFTAIKYPDLIPGK